MKTNNLTYKVNKVVGNEHIFVTIKLADECKNGHEDFSITADIYEADKPKIDRYNIMSGCCHEEILKAFPQFKIFVDLHLNDWLGAPMHAVANGFYHIHNKMSKDNFLDYFSVTPKEYEQLKKCSTQEEFSFIVQDIALFGRWKDNANKAISELEKLTGETFESKATRSNFTPLENMKELRKKYTNEWFKQSNVEQREKERKDALIAKKIKDLTDTATKSINKINEELNLKLQLVSLGFTDLSEAIYYTHTKELRLNWNKSTYSYNFTTEDFKLISNKLTLPEGATVTLNS